MVSGAEQKVPDLLGALERSIAEAKEARAARAAVPLPEPTLAEQALAAWDDHHARIQSDQDRVDSLNARHLDQAHRAVQARLGRAWMQALPGWEVARQVAEPAHHSVDLIADHDDEHGPWGLRYVSEITEAASPRVVRNGDGEVTRVEHEHHGRLLLIRPCPDDADEWQEIGWDLHSVLDLGGCLHQAVPPCGDRHPIWADDGDVLPDPEEF